MAKSPSFDGECLQLRTRNALVKRLLWVVPANVPEKRFLKRRNSLPANTEGSTREISSASIDISRVAQQTSNRCGL